MIFETLQSYDPQNWIQFTCKLTMRAIVGGLAGFYSLGFCYEQGIMAKIDDIAISLMLPSVGYAGLGAFMPTFQWYAAWGVRITAAFLATIVYDIAERVFIAAFQYLFGFNPIDPPSEVESAKPGPDNAEANSSLVAGAA